MPGMCLSAHNKKVEGGASFFYIVSFVASPPTPRRGNGVGDRCARRTDDAMASSTAELALAAIATAGGAISLVGAVRRFRLLAGGRGVQQASLLSGPDLTTPLLSTSSSPSRRPPAPRPRPRWGTARAACLLALSHAVTGILCFTAYPAWKGDPRTDALLAAAWAAGLAAVAVDAGAGRAPRCRPLAWAAPAAYVAEVVVAVQALTAVRTPAPPPPAAIALATLAALRLAAAFALAALQARPRPDDAAVASAVKAALIAAAAPPGGDLEAGGVGGRRRAGGPAGRPAGPQGSWVRLIGTAAAMVWPDEPALQARAAACMVLLLASRCANLAAPAAYRALVNALADAGEGRAQQSHPALTAAVTLYLVVSFLQGGPGGMAMGLLNNLRSYCWIPVSQAAAARVSVDAFAHMLGMDLRFHLLRKTGELTRVMDRGTAAIQSLLSTVLFSILPQLIDIVAASIYIAAALQPWIALILFVCLASYIPITILLTEWRGAMRKDLNARDNVRAARVTDALLNYETVAFFTAEGVETARFGGAIREYQQVEMKVLASLALLNTIQSTIIWGGTAAGLALCARGVSEGSLRVGDCVLFLALMAQLTGPLNWFGTFYRSLQQSCIDAEGVFALLATAPTVADAPGAQPLVAGDGSMSFDQVSYAWTPGVPVLKGVSLHIPGGSTLAVVGPTGSGKSTLLRLAFRFADPDAGRVLVDGQDARSVTLASLRSSMAVVAQDAVLFNESIRYNLAYGRPGASDAEIEAAAAAAAIDLTRFPAGLDTLVGERGLRLSGGEKQRVALARAIIRRARILLLDEATSALDTLTEAAVQEALAKGVGGGVGGGGGSPSASPPSRPTMLVVAHRLSTVVSADAIAVLRAGVIEEVGPHEALVGADGLYSQLWAAQSRGGNGGGAGGVEGGPGGGGGGPVSRGPSAADLAGLGRGGGGSGHGGGHG